MITYVNRYMLADNPEGKHIIFWPDSHKGKDKRLKHPLFKDPLNHRKYKTIIPAKLSPGNVRFVDLNRNHYLAVGVCLVQSNTPYPEVNLSYLLNCLKRVSVYAAAFPGTIHISTYPLYFSGWGEVLPIIRTTLQGLDVVIHQEKLRSKTDAIQAKDTMRRLPVQEGQVLSLN